MHVLTPGSDILSSNSDIVVPVLYAPGLYGILGPMFSGKTEEAIRRARRYALAGMTVQAFKFGADDRYEKEDLMAGYDGGTFPATSVMSVDQMKKAFDQNAKIVIVDESQFYDYTIIDFLSSKADEGYLVIYTGLNTNFRGEPFQFVVDPSDLEVLSNKTMGNLMAISDGLTLLSAVCRFNDDSRICGRPAPRTQRLNADGTPAYYTDPQFLVGSTETYEARCRWHHKVPGKP